MLLPNSALQKYAKMVIGLLLIAIIITPILGLFNKDFDDILTAATSEFEDQKKKDLGNLTEMKKKEIQATQGAYILKQMAVDLQAEVEEELMADYNMRISAIDVRSQERGRAGC
ncbi:stage III sporulation protein AF [Peribacillus frigoritolerans]|nr:stage III sporulation protein AF [Peribacillus frigoritolerans]